MHGTKRIAIYGGTFDPIHIGHLRVARNTVELFEITELLFVPARQAPHKLEREVTPPIHRYAMIALATQDDWRLLVSTVEIDAPGPQYTVDTLEHFRTAFSEPVELFFVMGADSWAEITTWREWERLLGTANFVVVTRPGYDIELDQRSQLVERIVDVRGWSSESVRRVLNEASEPRIYITDLAMTDVSASEIRKAARARRQEELRRFVPVPVAEYIIKYGLYLNANET